MHACPFDLTAVHPSTVNDVASNLLQVDLRRQVVFTIIMNIKCIEWFRACEVSRSNQALWNTKHACKLGS